MFIAHKIFEIYKNLKNPELNISTTSFETDRYNCFGYLIYLGDKSTIAAMVGGLTRENKELKIDYFFGSFDGRYACNDPCDLGFRLRNIVKEENKIKIEDLEEKLLSLNPNVLV